MQTLDTSIQIIKTAKSEQINQINVEIIEKFLHLLAIYNNDVIQHLPIELLHEYDFAVTLNKILTEAITSPDKLIKTQAAFFQECTHIYQQIINNTTEDNSILVLNGFNDFLEDLIRNKGHLSASITNKANFKVGENLAITPGKIIYQNELMQLIQYLPTTSTVYEKPILFIPPWINKYYILDLTPEKSLVRWLISQGFTVFMISWRNPDARMAEKDWGNYLLEGPMAALDAITKITNCSSVHLVGYCIGGTLLACALAYMQHNNDHRAASGSYFTTLLDFASPGEFGAFIDKQQLTLLKHIIDSKGYLDGKLLDIAFNMLRPNALVWPCFIKNYLLKQKPKAFDLLFWNADPTNLPKKMANFYLQNMYLKNMLKTPNEININNTPINLNKISIPTFFISAERDHIAPWQSTYAGVKLHNNSKVTFVLSEPGHVAGIINPPKHNKYSFKTNKHTYDTAEQWLQTAAKHEGSWWPFWKQWLVTHSKLRIKPEKHAIPETAIIENAPGTYVLKRI